MKPFEPANEKILHFKSLRTDIRTESDATVSYGYLTARLKSFRQTKASEGSALAQSTALGPCARTQPSHPHGPQSSTWIAGAYRLNSKRCRSVADRFLFNHVGSVCANVISPCFTASGAAKKTLRTATKPSHPEMSKGSASSNDPVNHSCK